MIQINTNTKFIRLVLSTLIALFMMSGIAQATTITVTGSDGTVADDGVCSISEAINSANSDAASGEMSGECPAGSGADIIELTTDITLTSENHNDAIFGRTGTPAITSQIVLNGTGHKLQRDASLSCLLDQISVSTEFRLLHITTIGNLQINNISLINGCSDGPVSIFDLGFSGGSIFNEGLLSIANSEAVNNQSNFGGVLLDYYGHITEVTNSTFSNNNASEDGGAFYFFQNSTIDSVINNTFSENTAGGYGGAINAGSSSNIAILNNNTFSGNEATIQSGAIYSLAATLFASYNLFHNNYASTNYDCYAQVGTGIHNISDEGNNNCGSVIITSSLNVFSVGPLADNGCITPLADGSCIKTHALTSVSEAIDPIGGTNTTLTDQRGYSHDGTRDIGAYEFLTPSEQCLQHGIDISSDFIANVSTPIELNTAIQCANKDQSTTDTINLGSDVIYTNFSEDDATYGKTAAAVIISPVVLNGMGYKLMREASLGCNSDDISDSSEFRLLRIANSGNLQINNLSLLNGCVSGISFSDKFYGGAIYNSGSLTLANSVVANNTALSSGGIENHGIITEITNSTFSGNNSSSLGGAMTSYFTIGSINNNTFSGNSADSGGGIVILNSTINSLLNNTFSGNQATSNGGSIVGSGGTISALNNLFHNNSSDCFQSNTTFTGSNNLSDQNSSNCGVITPDSFTSDTVGVLADNSCVTPLADGTCIMTHALLKDSTATDGSLSGTANDQRGYAAYGVRDIGAYEIRSPSEQCSQNGMNTSAEFTANVASVTELNAAIECANINSTTSDTIEFGSDITYTEFYEDDPIYGKTAAPVITSPIMLNGLGYKLLREASLSCDVNQTSETNEFRLLRIATGGDLQIFYLSLLNGCTDGGGFFDLASYGGSIYNEGALSLKYSVVSNNTAGFGGGVGNLNIGNISEISNSTFSGNIATFSGGAVASLGTSTIGSIYNSTFSANSADQGGGIYSIADISSLNNNTFSGNSVTTSGGGVNLFGTVNITNNLFHNNSGPNADCNQSNNTITGSNNISNQDNGDCGGVITPNSLTTNTIGSLTDNGCTVPMNDGTCILTHAILTSNSQAFGTSASGTTHDQRGFAAFGVRDIGAYELTSVLEQYCLQNGMVISDSFTVTVTTEAELDTAIECANATNTTDTIELGNDITYSDFYEDDGFTGKTATPTITSPIIIDGKGYILARNPANLCTINGINETGEFRLMRLKDNTADLELKNIVMQGGCADDSSAVIHHGIAGAVYMSGGNLNIDNSVFANNQSRNVGGAIYLVDANTTTINEISNSTFSNNLSGRGGVIYSNGPIQNIENNTFSGNTAQGYDSTTAQGGVIWNNSLITTLNNNTFSGNNSNSEGGVIYSRNTITNITNSLFHDNNAVTSKDCHLGDGTVSGSNNMSDHLSNNCSSAGISSTLTTSTVNILADNGCTTPLADGSCVMTHALLVGSEAIDAAISGNAADQRGFNAVGTRDIGAFENNGIQDLIFKNGFEN